MYADLGIDSVEVSRRGIADGDANELIGRRIETGALPIARWRRHTQVVMSLKLQVEGKGLGHCRQPGGHGAGEHGCAYSRRRYNIGRLYFADPITGQFTSVGCRICCLEGVGNGAALRVDRRQIILEPAPILIGPPILMGDGNIAVDAGVQHKGRAGNAITVGKRRVWFQGEGATVGAEPHGERGRGIGGAVNRGETVVVVERRAPFAGAGVTHPGLAVGSATCLQFDSRRSIDGAIDSETLRAVKLGGDHVAAALGFSNDGSAK